jgi:hypothetical protein
MGRLTSWASSRLAEVQLIWIPGADEAASAFYWDAFAVMAQAVSPAITDDEIAALERSLGKSSSQPPFSGSATASAQGLTYRRYVTIYDSPEQGTIDVSAISVS